MTVMVSSFLEKENRMITDLFISEAVVDVGIGNRRELVIALATCSIDTGVTVLSALNYHYVNCDDLRMSESL